MSLSAKDRLVLIRVKIERAKKHLSELEKEVRPYRRSQLYVVGMKQDPNSGEMRLHRGTLAVLPLNALATAGDAIQNTRSALDHLAFQLAQVGLSGGEPHREVAFPIAASADIYKTSKARKIQGMRQDAVKAIDALKPCKGGNEPLWQIHSLNNIDKHRLIFTVSHDHMFTGGFNGGLWLKARDPVFTGIFKPEEYEEAKFAANETVNKKTTVEGQALLPTLHQLVIFVDNLVGNFEPLLE